MMLSQSQNQSYRFDKLTCVDSGRSNMLLSQYFKKNNILLNFFNQIIFLLIVWIIFKPINLTELLQINPHRINNIFFYIKNKYGTGAKLKETGPGASND